MSETAKDLGPQPAGVSPQCPPAGLPPSPAGGPAGSAETEAPKRFGRLHLAPLDSESDALWRELAFRALPSAHRLAMALVLAQGLTYAEVGHVLDCPVPVVQRLLYEAREAMRIAALASLVVPTAPAHTPAAGGVPATLVMEEV